MSRLKAHVFLAAPRSGPGYDGKSGRRRLSLGAAVVSGYLGARELGLHVDQAVVAPFPSGRARQQATRRGPAWFFPSIRIGPSALTDNPNPDTPDGRHEQGRRARFPPCRPRRTGQAPVAASGPRKPVRAHRLTRNGRDRGFRGRLMSSPHPPAAAARSPCCNCRGRRAPAFEGSAALRHDKASGLEMLFWQVR